MEATLKPNGRPALHRGMPLLALGFRPFYLLASSFAALSILLWIGVEEGPPLLLSKPLKTHSVANCERV